VIRRGELVGGLVLIGLGLVFWSEEGWGQWLLIGLGVLALLHGWSSARRA
jgi:hypothetical protein